MPCRPADRAPPPPASLFSGFLLDLQRSLWVGLPDSLSLWPPHASSASSHCVLWHQELHWWGPEQQNGQASHCQAVWRWTCVYDQRRTTFRWGYLPGGMAVSCCLWVLGAEFQVFDFNPIQCVRLGVPDSSAYPVPIRHLRLQGLTQTPIVRYVTCSIPQAGGCLEIQDTWLRGRALPLVAWL